jgi:hypothetical protein
MDREQCLNEAAACVLRDRNKTHGGPEESFGKIAKGWAVIKGIEFTSADVALMMAWLKIVRASGNPEHGDNWVDMAGYAACGAELATGDTE